MATAGPNLPSSATNNSAVGVNAWSNPGNATGDDNNYASVTGTSAAQSYYLWCTSFGFSIPSGSTVNGVTVSIARYADQSGTLRYALDNDVRLIVNGSISGNNKADANKWPLSEATVNYGGAADLWGLMSLSASDVNATNFGVALSIKNYGAQGCTGFVDWIKMQIDYTPPSAGVTLQQMHYARMRQ